MMAEDDKTPDGAKPALPGNHGQFGANDATEDYKPLDNHPAPGEPASEGAKQTNAGERS